MNIKSTHLKLKYKNLEKLAKDDLKISHLMKAESDRLENFVLREGPLRADFSKQLVSQKTLKSLKEFAAACNLEEWRAKLFAGEKINDSENRAVLHMALRDIGGSDSVKENVRSMRKRMEKFANNIRAEEKFNSIVHIGIGGSDLGPRLVADAFRATADIKFDLRFAENIDGASINDALDGLNPKKTLIIVVSKSFTTQETHMNAEAAFKWLESELGVNAGKHLVAVTANRQGAIDFKVPEEQIFDFWDWVGGRYSVWSSVGLSLQIAFGPSLFGEFLKGASKMDLHFRDQPLHENLPVMMAIIGIWNRNFLNYSSLAVIPYSRNIRKLPAFLQQLEMESNGKQINREGVYTGITCPIIWGDQGTNGQHAFFQWLHQGTPGAPVDFIAVLKDSSGRPEHHAALLANCFAQSEALMLGKSKEQVLQEIGDGFKSDIIAQQKTFPGNRPSTTITLDNLTPYSLGHLIALYEHKVFVQGVIWNINSFDQWGVELGKVLASNILQEMQTGTEGKHDASTSKLIELFVNSMKSS